MKIILTLIVFIAAVGCNEPLQVTAHPDDRSATSGTLGSSKAETQLPVVTRDSSRTDTVPHR